MIDYKELVLLNGFHQKIHVKTDDVGKPVLLFLHGGAITRLWLKATNNL